MEYENAEESSSERSRDQDMVSKPLFPPEGIASAAIASAAIASVTSTLPPDEGEKEMKDAKTELKELNEKIIVTLLRAENCTRLVSIYYVVLCSLICLELL